MKNPKNISDIPHQKIHRKDLFVKVWFLHFRPTPLKSYASQKDVKLPTTAMCLQVAKTIKANGHSLPRDSWRKLLALVSESGQVTSLFGDSEGVVISFR